MNRLARALLATTLFALPAAPALAGGPRLGAPAPAFHARLLDGSRFDLAEHRGEVVLVHYWATWCVPCQIEMPALAEFRAAHAGQGFAVVTVSMDDAENHAEVARHAAHLGLPVAMASGVEAAGYGRIWRLPISFVIDRAGLLRADGGQGEAVVYDRARLERELAPLLAAPR